MAGRFGRKRAKESPELDVTTFMNLMVVLVPFLLLSAAFSEITIHDLNLPTIAEGSASEGQKKLNLEVVIRNDLLDLLDRNNGRLAMIPNKSGKHDFATLHEKLKQIKLSYPQSTQITLLLDPNVKYEALIGAMDAARSDDPSANGKGPKRDLFPDVSIGDAPVVSSVGGAS